jgi:hypothetical protein
MALGSVADVRESDINLFDIVVFSTGAHAAPRQIHPVINLHQVNHAAVIAAKFFTS